MQNFDRINIYGQSLRQPVFAMQLENIERKLFDGSLAKYQIRQYFHQNFALYGIWQSDRYPWLVFVTIIN